MTLTELRYILAVAEVKHFSRAAEKCHVSQPSLSTAINKLEKSLGISIFERNRNEVRVSKIGEKIIAQAKLVLEEAEKLKLLADSNSNQLAEPLKIGAIYTVAPYLFPTLIPSIKKLSPDLKLVIQEGYTSELREKLRTGELDAIFIALPFTDTNVVATKLYDEPFEVVLPCDHPLSKKKTISKSDLQGETVMLLGAGNCFRDQVIEHCPNCYQPSEAQEAIEGTSIETLRHMVASGMGITVPPKSATNVQHYKDSLCVKPFDGNAPKREIALAWRASFPRTKAIDVLIAAAKMSF